MENKNRLSLSTSLWKKISRVAGKAGVKVVYAALALYYVTRDGAVPTFTKLKIYGALAYFIMPVDLIPDFIIGLGFADDLAALTWAFFEVQKHITPEIDRKVMTKLRNGLVTSTAANSTPCAPTAASPSTSTSTSKSTNPPRHRRGLTQTTLTTQTSPQKKFLHAEIFCTQRFFARRPAQTSADFLFLIFGGLQNGGEEAGHGFKGHPATSLHSQHKSSSLRRWTVLLLLQSVHKACSYLATLKPC